MKNTLGIIVAVAFALVGIAGGSFWLMSFIGMTLTLVLKAAHVPVSENAVLYGSWAATVIAASLYGVYLYRKERSNGNIDHNAEEPLT